MALKAEYELMVPNDPNRRAFQTKVNTTKEEPEGEVLRFPVGEPVKVARKNLEEVLLVDKGRVTILGRVLFVAQVNEGFALADAAATDELRRELGFTDECVGPLETRKSLVDSTVPDAQTEPATAKAKTVQPKGGKGKSGKDADVAAAVAAGGDAK